MNAFLTWQEAFAAGPEVCGGKGWNLARLARYGFRTPRGGVLAAGAPLSALREGLQRLGLEGARLAVRSSATAEDSARASFAGIHRSFLNVQGLEAVEQAAQGCLDSLQTEAAIAYRRRMGFRDEEVRCAVVVCEMVQARAAGVAFTCDPSNGRRDLVILDAAEGLGEAVVSGRVNPQRSIWRNRGGEFAPESGSLAGLLPQDVEAQLVRQARRILWALGEGQDPQDIEWAWDGKELWFVQARPVTRLPRAGFAETADLPRYWSSGNIKDAVPGVVGELSWSLLAESVGSLAYASALISGYALPPGLEVVRRFDGRGLFDITLMQWVFFDCFGLPPKDVLEMLGGEQPEIPVPPNGLAGAEGKRRNRARLKLLGRILNSPAKRQRVIDGYLARQRENGQREWRGATREQMLQFVAEAAAAQAALLPAVGVSNAAYGPWRLGLEGLVKDPALAAALQAGAGAVASAEQGYRIYDIARGAATLERFLHDFGHRAVYEADILNPRWAEDPAWVVEQVEAARRMPPAEDPRLAAARAREKAEQELKRRLGWRAPLALWFARKLRAAMAQREIAKSALVSGMLPLRKMALEMGRRMVEAGQLSEPAQALHLSWADVSAWLLGDWTGEGAAALAGDRAARRLAWLALPARDLVTEEPDGSVRAPAVNQTHASDSSAWTGLAIAPGIAQGPARVIHTPFEAARLQPGDVLVAPSTDPGWTPLFLRASALVMETGGYLSHGAIVAREYGIPAVANMPGILAALTDGELIEVDGSTGSVRRLPR